MYTVSSADRRRRRPTALTAGLVALLVSTAMLLWGALPAGASPLLQATGSSFAGVAIQGWTSQAGILYGANINFQITNSVTGMSFFAQNQVDFGASDIPYSTGQSPYNPTLPYQYLPDVAGGLALMFNLTGKDGQRINNLNLNADAIADIFLGKIQYWDDGAISSINPQLAGDLPHTPILAVYRNDGAGENYLLSDYLLHQASSTFVAAQTAFGLSTSGPSAIGSPSATWPTPVCESNGGCRPSQLPGYPGWTTGTGLDGQDGADNSANFTASASNNGAITYVETAYAKEHALPVANLANASGGAVQPTSVNVATALEAAILHADLTQDLTNVYTNPLPNAYPLSAYSYLITQCSPALAAPQHITCAADPGGAASNLPSDKGQELGQFINFMACAGQQNMSTIGYSPLPPNLVEEDFLAIGRLNGGKQPPAPTAANCKNPYVDGTTPLPGSPVIQGLPGVNVPGASGTGSTTTSPTASGGGTTTTSASKGRSGASGGNTNGASPAAVAKACQQLATQDKGLAAEACTGNGTLKSGYSYVNGQIVRTLPDGEARALRADALVSAAGSVFGPHTGEVLGWIVLALAVLAAPPLIALRRRKSREVRTRE